LNYRSHFEEATKGVIAPVGIWLRNDYSRLMNTRDLTDKIQDLQERATKAAKNMGQVTDDYVHDNTWTSIACAALLGCVVGFLLARRD
jgi:ElaB/YqjD/DUF883 family membrane-anchored ribosome-binding protein